MPTTFDLKMGKTATVVGTVVVTNDADNIYVTYNVNVGLTGGLDSVHVWVGNNLLDLPGGGTERPAPGQLTYKFDNLGCVETYQVVIPRDDANIVDVLNPDQCGKSIYVVAHASLCNGATAFGGPTPGPNTDGNQGWWWYGSYIICCLDTDTDGGDPVCQTAFGYGNYVFTTDPKSNPEGKSSLSLIKNRWGWAKNFKNEGTYTVALWAGAGLNNTANGTNVGTVTYDWDGTVLTVTYEITKAGYWLTATHLYARDFKPANAKALAPGQYGIQDTWPSADKNTTATYTVSVSDSNNDGIWIIAHAVVCHNEPSAP